MTPTVPLSQVLAQAREIAALRAERDHYKRESELGATMLGVIVSSLGLGEKASSKEGANVKDILDHVAALAAEVARLRIAHDRADGALADAATVPTGDLERGIRALTATCTAERTRSTLAFAGWKEIERQFYAAEADVKALAEALRELMMWSTELDDERLQYIVVQVGREEIAIASAALARPGVVRVREE